MDGFALIKDYLTELGLVYEVLDAEDQIICIDEPDKGLHNLILDCEDTLLVLEQPVCKLKSKEDAAALRTLLQLNRCLVHGAWVLAEDGEQVLYRETLQLAHLEPSELSASIESLGLALVEHGQTLIAISKEV